jgi:hypothetical protein
VEEVEAAGPYGVAGIPGGDRDDVGEILVLRSGPADVVRLFLIEALRGAQGDPGERDRAFAEPIDIGEGRLPVARPVEAGVDGHVGRVNRCRAARAEVKIGLLQRGGPRVGKVEAQLDHVVALALVGFRHGVGFADFEAIGQLAEKNRFVRRSAPDEEKATQGDAGYFGQSADG